MAQINYGTLFEGIQTTIKSTEGKTLKFINFDNGATTPPFKSVNYKLKELIDHYGPIGRGTGAKGDYCSSLYEDSKEEILRFFEVETNPDYQVAYVKNTTEGINLLSNIIEKGSTILTTRMEHHSNDLPWRQKHQVIYIEPTKEGRIDLDEVESIFQSYNGTIKYLTVTGASNVTGYINPIYELAAIAHKYQAKIIVDGAQLIGHRLVNLYRNDKEYIDFIVFSGHKVYAPYGSGAVVGRFKEIQSNHLFMWGGGMVSKVKDHTTEIGAIPSCYEAGTQNLFGAIALSTALTQLKELGYHRIKEHEDSLKIYTINQLKAIEHVILYADNEEIEDRIGVIPFAIKYQNCAEVAEKLAYEYGIATRFGKFCAHTYVERILSTKVFSEQEFPSYYGEYGLVRISFGLYNTKEEVDVFIKAIKQLQ